MRQLQDDLFLESISGGSNFPGSGTFSVTSSYENDDDDSSQESNTADHQYKINDDLGFDMETTSDGKNYGAFSFPGNAALNS